MKIRFEELLWLHDLISGTKNDKYFCEKKEIDSYTEHHKYSQIKSYFYLLLLKNHK